MLIQESWISIELRQNFIDVTIRYDLRAKIVIHTETDVKQDWKSFSDHDLANNFK